MQHGGNRFGNRSSGKGSMVPPPGLEPGTTGLEIRQEGSFPRFLRIIRHGTHGRAWKTWGWGQVRGQVYSRGFRRAFFSASRESAFNRETFSDLPPPHGIFSTVSISLGDFGTPSSINEECFIPRKIECRWGGKNRLENPYAETFQFDSLRSV